MLHLGFWVSLIFIAFLTLGMSADSSEKKAAANQHVTENNTAQTTTSNTSQNPEAPTSAGTAVLIYVLFGIPPLIFRHFAAGIHRRQCMEDAARAAAVQGMASGDRAAPVVHAAG
jgi:hypothetical protein